MIILYEDPKIAKMNSKLKKTRVVRGLTQEALSELSGVNIKSIAAYEQCPEKFNNASVGTVYKIADVLRCDMEDLIDKKQVLEEESNNDV